MAIRSVRHVGSAAFLSHRRQSGHPACARLSAGRILAVLDAATGAQEVTLPGLRLHPLKGDQAGRWAVSVSGNWRVSFGFTGEDVTEVDYEDYH